MSNILIENWKKIQFISEIKSIKLRKQVLKEFSRDENFCKAVKEIAANIVNKNVKLGEKEKRKLKKHKKCIMCLAGTHKSKKKVQSAIQQTGTGIFLPVVIPLIAEAISHLITK